MSKQSRRQAFLQERAAGMGLVDLSTAVRELKAMEPSLPDGVRKCAFDQTVELVFRLGVDPRQADQIVRGSLVLPHGIGKTQRVVVFAQGEQASEAEEAGADAVGAKELADKIQGGWMDFDVAIATPDLMGLVGPLGRVLGPRGLMPSPKAGTVTNEVAATVKEYKAGKIEFRVDKFGIVHAVVGKLSFDETQLLENAEALVRLIESMRPSSAKGTYIRTLTLSATMTPGITVAA
ncbi:50S ribosomal protein L1 [Planctomycetaceae bacterium]|nr:50S ribosomal protein L1 [Planctomycetaceae bacterium]